MTLFRVFKAASIFLRIISSAIFIYTVLSWFRPRNNLYLWLESFVRPFVAPFRRLNLWLASRIRLPLDFSCWFAIIGISIVEQLLWRLYALLRLIP